MKLKNILYSITDGSLRALCLFLICLFNTMKSNLSASRNVIIIISVSILLNIVYYFFIKKITNKELLVFLIVSIISFWIAYITMLVIRNLLPVMNNISQEINNANGLQLLFINVGYISLNFIIKMTLSIIRIFKNLHNKRVINRTINMNSL